METATRVIEHDWRNVSPVIRDFLRDRTYVTGLFGPLGSAKTSAGVMKTWLYSQAWPGANIAVIRTTWPRLRDTTQAEFFKWFPAGVAGHYEATPHVFHLATKPSVSASVTIRNEPAHVMFRALEDQADVENVLSLSLAAAWVDEPQGGLALENRTITAQPGMNHQLFLNLLSRLGRQPNYLRMCWLTGNPPDPSHWIAREFRYTGEGQPENMRENFHLYLADRETNRRNLYHTPEGNPCRLCGKDSGEIIHRQGDYYRDQEELFGVGTPLAQRFILGRWIPFKSLKPFAAENIRYVGDLPESERPTVRDTYNVLGVDPAITKRDEGSRSSLTLAGTCQGKTIIWRNTSGHWSPYELCGQILEWLERFPVAKIRIEDVAWQGALKDIVTREAELRGIRLPYIDPDCKPKGDKLLCAMRWAGPVEQGRVLFDASCVDLVDCMLRVPEDKTAWDPVDATSRAIEGLPTGAPASAGWDRGQELAELGLIRATWRDTRIGGVAPMPRWMR